jgi:hydrogenase expression/formation protein HypC
MCLAVLGRIQRIDDDQQALVDYQGMPLTVDLGLVKAAVGDTVLIHAGCAIAILDPEELVRWQDLMADLSAVMAEDAGSPG